MSTPASDQPIKLVSSDKRVFTVPIRIAKMSTLISTMMEDMQNGSKPDNGEVSLSTVSGDILELVIEWCNQHKDDGKPKQGSRDDNTQWDEAFLANIGQGTLMELTKVSEYLGISGLLDMTCKAIAQMMKGKSPEEVREIFKIENDFTPEEEERIIRENEWIDRNN